jgi:putative hemolysin
MSVSARRIATRIAVLVCGAMVLAGCSTHAGPSVQPLSDEQARAQVIDPAREVVKAAGLQITYATFEWGSCNDQGDPPYQGEVNVAFVIPPGVDAQVLSKQVAAAAAKQPGWAPGPPPDGHLAGELAHKGNVAVTVGPGNYPDRGSVQVYGECRNMTDHHHHDERSEITEDLRR